MARCHRGGVRCGLVNCSLRSSDTESIHRKCEARVRVGEDNAGGVR